MKFLFMMSIILFCSVVMSNCNLFLPHLNYSTRHVKLDKKRESLKNRGRDISQSTICLAKFARHFELCWYYLVDTTRGLGILDQWFIIRWHARCSTRNISREFCLEWHSRGTVHFHVSCTVANRLLNNAIFFEEWKPMSNYSIYRTWGPGTQNKKSPLFSSYVRLQLFASLELASWYLICCGYNERLLPYFFTCHDFAPPQSSAWATAPWTQKKLFVCPPPPAPIFWPVPKTFFLNFF